MPIVGCEVWVTIREIKKVGRTLQTEKKKDHVRDPESKNFWVFEEGEVQCVCTGGRGMRD